MTDKLIVGNAEFVSLPSLQLQGIRARVDTGAKTSSLHVDNIESFTKDNIPYVRFVLSAAIYDVSEDMSIEAVVVDTRWIKSSNGSREERYVIYANMLIANQQWDIELTLSDRDEMSFPMLLGRQAMAGRILVDPSESYLLGDG